MKTGRWHLLGFAALGSLLGGAGACAGADAEPASGESDEALRQTYAAPDPSNPWTKGKDLAQMKIGEENVLEGEDAMFAGFAREIADMQHRLAQKAGGPPLRGFHAKSHACVRGELRVEVPASFPQARVGVFAKNGTYPTWVRYSNGTGFVQADRSTDVRGVALKIMKVPGPALVGSASTQDFLLTNGAVTPAADAQKFVEFGRAMTDARVHPDGSATGIVEGLLTTGTFLLRPENVRIRDYLLSRAAPRVLTRGSVLGEQFWSGGAFAMGLKDGDPLRAPARNAAKMTTIAGVMEGARCVPVRDLPNLFDKDYLRTDVTKRMKDRETCLEIRLQMQRDPALQPIEDTSMEWLERDAPMVSVGYVHIPRTDLEGDPGAKTREAFCNELAFTPWHSHRDHRPLGNIMRARRAPYESSRAGREGRAEPTGNELP